MRDVCMKYGQQIPGLPILGLQIVESLNVLRMGMEKEEGDTTLTGG